MDTYLWLAFVAIGILFLNVILYAKGAVSRNRPLQYFTWYLFFLLCVELITLFIAKVLHAPNLFMSHIYFAGQFILLSVFFASLLRASWIYYVMGVVLIFVSYQYISDPELLQQYNMAGMSLTSILLVCYAMLYFYHSLREKKQFLIVTTGMFLYLLSSNLIFASGNLILKLDLPENTQYHLININRVLYVVFQLLIFIEWVKNYRGRLAL